MCMIIHYTIDRFGYAPNPGERYYQFPHGNLKCLHIERDRKTGRVFVTSEIEPNTTKARRGQHHEHK